MINEYNYHCFHCKNQLNKDQEVEFLIERNTKEKARIFLSPTPKSYNYRTEPAIKFEKDEIVDFFCVQCNKSLVSEEYPKFIKIHLKVTENVLIDVFFSRIHGVQKTYVGLEDFKETYGDEMDL
ncbi:MAG: hypothetical protein H6587_11100 [Flavobacteriales bacterium]|nr:hypothetical protein [Flavobacteriales bacterium]MCB9365106.1 hypothetical protein [Flavobacteriales bacterium]